MPIYEYKCETCSHVFEEFAGINGDHKQSICPKCGKPAYKKISKTSFHLKGQGFHNTDYKKNSGECGKGENKCSCASCPASKSE